MFELRIHSKTKEDQAQVRDMLCRALRGWKPFVDTEVAVTDTYETDHEPVTHLVMGKNPPEPNEDTMAIDVAARDLRIILGTFPLTKTDSNTPVFYDEKG